LPDSFNKVHIIWQAIRIRFPRGINEVGGFIAENAIKGMFSNHIKAFMFNNLLINSSALSGVISGK
jgi:hypothetical protein